MAIQNVPVKPSTLPRPSCLKSWMANWLAINLHAFKTKRGFGPFLQKETDMKHQKYNHYPEVKNAKLNARAEAAVDFLAAIAVGIVLAVLLAWRG